MENYKKYNTEPEENGYIPPEKEPWEDAEAPGPAEAEWERSAAFGAPEEEPPREEADARPGGDFARPENPPPGYGQEDHPPRPGYPPYGPPPANPYAPPQNPYPPQGPPVQGGYQPAYPHQGYRPPNPYLRPVRNNANIVCGGLLLMLLLGRYLLVYPLQELLFSIPANIYEEHYSAIIAGAELLLYTGMFLIPCILMQKLIRIPTRYAYPLRPVRPSMVIPAIFVALGGSFVGMIISGGLSEWFETFTGWIPTMPDMSPPEGIAAIVIHCVSIAIAPAILEEMMYRGVIMQSLRRFGDGFALVVSSILFSLGHGNLLQGPTSLCAGLVMGYFVLRTGSLWTSIIIHFANNALVVALDLLTDYGPAGAADTANLALFYMYTLGAIIAVVFLCIRNKNMFRLAPSHYPVRPGRKYNLFFTSAAPIVYVLVMIYITSTYFER